MSAFELTNSDGEKSSIPSFAAHIVLYLVLASTAEKPTLEFSSKALARIVVWFDASKGPAVAAQNILKNYAGAATAGFRNEKNASRRQSMTGIAQWTLHETKWTVIEWWKPPQRQLSYEVALAEADGGSICHPAMLGDRRIRLASSSTFQR